MQFVFVSTGSSNKVLALVTHRCANVWFITVTTTCYHDLPYKKLPLYSSKSARNVIMSLIHVNHLTTVTLHRPLFINPHHVWISWMLILTRGNNDHIISLQQALLVSPHDNAKSHRWRLKSAHLLTHRCLGVQMWTSVTGFAYAKPQVQCCKFMLENKLCIRYALQFEGINYSCLNGI